MKKIICLLIVIICVVSLVILFNMHADSILYLRGILKTKPVYYCPLMSQLSLWATMFSVTGFGFIAVFLNMGNDETLIIE